MLYFLFKCPYPLLNHMLIIMEAAPAYSLILGNIVCKFQIYCSLMLAAMLKNCCSVIAIDVDSRLSLILICLCSLTASWFGK